MKIISLLLALMLLLTPIAATAASPSPTIDALYKVQENNYFYHSEEIQPDYEFFADYYNLYDAIPLHINHDPSGVTVIVEFPTIIEDGLLILVDYDANPVGVLSYKYVDEGCYIVTFLYVIPNIHWVYLLLLGW